MKETPIYQRTRGMHYTIVNAHHKPDGYGGVTMVQGIEAFFKPQSDLNQVGEFDPTRYVENWINNEITAGRLEYDDEVVSKKKEEMINRICSFIERHPDYQMKAIWKKPTKAEIAAQTRERIEREKQLLAQQEAEIKDPESIPDEKVDEAIKEKTAMNPKEAELVQGGGVTKGAATTANTRKT